MLRGSRYPPSSTHHHGERDVARNSRAGGRIRVSASKRRFRRDHTETSLTAGGRAYEGAAWTRERHTGVYLHQPLPCAGHGIGPGEAYSAAAPRAVCECRVGQRGGYRKGARGIKPCLGGNRSAHGRRPGWPRRGSNSANVTTRVATEPIVSPVNSTLAVGAVSAPRSECRPAGTRTRREDSISAPGQDHRAITPTARCSARPTPHRVAGPKSQPLLIGRR